jgi:hypothetical protein
MASKFLVLLLATLLTGCCCFGGSVDDDLSGGDTQIGPPHSEGTGNGI